MNICQDFYAADTEKINEAKVKTGNWLIKGVILSTELYKIRINYFRYFIHRTFDDTIGDKNTKYELQV